MLGNNVDIENICRKYYTFGLNRIGGDSFSEYECYQLAILEINSILKIIEWQDNHYMYYYSLKLKIEKKINKIKKLDESEDCLFEY